MPKRRKPNSRVQAKPELPKDCPWTMPEIREMNKRHDHLAKQIPSWMVSVPCGFSKALDDNDLDAIVCPQLAELRERERAEWIARQVEELSMQSAIQSAGSVSGVVAKNATTETNPANQPTQQPPNPPSQ